MPHTEKIMTYDSLDSVLPQEELQQMQLNKAEAAQIRLDQEARTPQIRRASREAAKIAIDINLIRKPRRGGR